MIDKCLLVVLQYFPYVFFTCFNANGVLIKLRGLGTYEFFELLGDLGLVLFIDKVLFQGITILLQIGFDEVDIQSFNKGV